MNKAVPWSIKGVDFDAREAAKEAARRSGMSLGEWLNTVIAEQAQENGIPPDEVDADMRLEAIAAKLARMNSRTDLAAMPPDAPANRRERARQQDAGEIYQTQSPTRRPVVHAGRMEDTEIPRSPAPTYREAEAAIRSDNGRSQRRSRRIDAVDIGDERHFDDYRTANLVDPETLLNDAVKQFDQRAEVAQKKTANALANVAQWMETSETRRENERNMLAKVTRKLDEIQHRVSSRDDEGDNLALEALGKVARRLDTIESRVLQRNETEQAPVRKSLERLESKMEALARRPVEVPGFETTLRDMDGKIAALNQRLEKSLEAPANPLSSPLAKSAGRFGAATKAPFNDAITDIMRRQRMLDDVAQDKGRQEFDQRLGAISARLERANQKISAANELPAELRQTAISRPETRNIVANAALPDPQLAKLRQEVAELSTTLASLAPRGSVEALEGAMRDLGQRIDNSRNSNAAETLGAPLDKTVSDLRHALHEQNPTATLEKLHREVKALHDKMEQANHKSAPPDASLGLLAQMQEIRELITQNAARPLPFETIERQIASLSERIDKNARKSGPMGVVRSQQPDMSALTENIREVIDRALPGPALQHLEQRLDHLDSKIDDALSRSQAPDAQMAELSRRMSDVQHALTAPAGPAKIDMRPFEEMMREISQKLETPKVTEVSPSHFKALENQLAFLAARLDAPVASGPNQEMLAQIEDLSRSIHSLQQQVSQQPSVATVDNSSLEETLRELARTLEHARKPEPPVQLLQAVEAQLTKVAEKLEHSNQGLWALSSNASTHFETLSKRIDAVQFFVANQLDDLHASAGSQPAPAKPDLGHLEDMVRGLANQIETVRGDNPSTHAIGNLERQIERIAAQMEKSGSGFAALASLERSVHELFAQLEDTRNTALDAAETAARTAARDTLREAMQAGGGIEVSDAARQFAIIKSEQEENGRQTHSTLSKVHDTLERVVDRLTSLEQDKSHAAKIAPAMEAKAAAARNIGPEARSASLVAMEREDFLIEPGQGRAPVKEATKPSSTTRTSHVAAVEPPGPVGEKGNLQNIIAAARRLHQAQAEKSVAEMAATPRSRVSSRTPGANGSVASLPLLARARDYLVVRKRPVLLMVASLLLVFGTVEVVRVFGLSTSGPAKTSELKSDPNAKTAIPADAKPVEPAVDPRKGAALVDQSGNAKLADKGANVDTTPVASIAAPPAALGLTPPKSEANVPLDNPLLRIAAQGNAAAQYEMGLRLGEGRGVTRDMVAAAAWLEKAANQNLAPAQYRTGSMYEKGIGVTRDIAQAKSWYLRAANAGNTRAMHNLAVLTADAGDGKPDYSGAVAWFTKAAEYGVRDSQFNLAVLCARGLGLPQNLVKSWVWFSLAANQGDTDAASKKKDVAARLDNKQLEQAQTELAAFKTKTAEIAANEVLAPPEGWDAYATKISPKTENPKYLGVQGEGKPAARAKAIGL